MKNKQVSTAVVCLLMGVAAGVWIQRLLPTGSSENQATGSRLPQRIETAKLSSNAVLIELTNIFVELPRRQSGEIGPAAVARFSEAVRRVDAHAFPVVARTVLTEADQSAEAMLGVLLPIWVKDDLSAARQFASQLEGKQREAFLKALVPAWLRQDQQSCTEWLLQSDEDTFKLVIEARRNPGLTQFHPTNAYRVWLRLPEQSRKQAGWTFFSQWAFKDPAAAVMAMAPHVSEDRLLYGTMRSAFTRWMEKDTHAAVAFVANLEDNGLRRDLLAAAMPSLGKTAPQKALELIQGVPEGSNRQDLLRQLMIYWGEANPSEAFGVARNFPEGPDRKTALSATLARITGKSPDLVKEFLLAEPSHPSVVEQAHAIAEQFSTTNASVILDWADRLPPGKTRDAILFQGITGSDVGNPRRSVELAVQHLSGIQRQSAIRVIFRRWTLANAIEAAKGAEESPLGVEKGVALAEVASQWAARDMDAATDWVLGLPANSARQSAEKEIVRALSAEKPARAAEFSGKLQYSTHSAALVDTAVRRWAELDLGAAVSWMKGHPNATNFGKAFGSLARTVMTANPPLAAEFAERVPASNDDYGIRGQIATEWAKQDPEAATRWVGRMVSTGDDKLRWHFHSVFEYWARINPNAALAYAEALSKSTNANLPLTSYSQFKQTAIASWSAQEPAAVLSWLKTNSTGRSQIEARQWVLAAWARRSPIDTYKWLNQLPSGDERTWSADYALPFIAAHQPDLAIRGLALLSDAVQRERVMESIYRGWVGFDEHGARSWLQTNSLPASTKMRLLKEGK